MDKWLAPSKIKFFKQQINSPCRNITFQIESQLIIGILARTFEPASRDTYLVMVKAPTVFSQMFAGSLYREEELLGAEKAINEHEKLLNEFLDLRIQQAIQRLEGGGYDLNTFKREFKCYEATVTSAFAKNFIDLYVKADLLYSLHFSLWLLGELAEDTAEANFVHRGFERDLKKQLHAYSAALTKHAGNVQRLMDRLREERKAYRAAQSQRDKSLHQGSAYSELPPTDEGKAAANDRKQLREQLPEIIQQLKEEVDKASSENMPVKTAQEPHVVSDAAAKERKPLVAVA